MSIRAFDVLDSSCTWRMTASLIELEFIVTSGRPGFLGSWVGGLNGELQEVNMRKAEGWET